MENHLKFAICHFPFDLLVPSSVLSDISVCNTPRCIVPLALGGEGGPPSRCASSGGGPGEGVPGKVVIVSISVGQDTRGGHPLRPS